jgi:hypothetical protein
MFVAKQHIRLFRQVFLTAVFGLVVVHSASAMTEPTVDYSPAELEELVGPVALYPDDLIAIILPASSYPLQIVEAARYLKKVEENPDLEPDNDWDDAIVALLNYPQVIALLNEDLDWTWNLGSAVVNQQAAVLDAIQDFRGRAVAAGNLETDDRQTVSQVGDVIEITPVEPEVIYVPYYEPEQVVVYQRWPAYHYYPDAYPLYYYPYPVHYRFASGFFWGVTTAYTIGWLTDRVHFHYYGHASHPYYGHHYTSHYYARRAGRVRHHDDTGSRRHFADNRHHYGNTWKPRQRHGDRPRHNRAVTDRHQGVVSNFTGSARRHSRAGDERIRSSGKRHTRLVALDRSGGKQIIATRNAKRNDGPAGHSRRTARETRDEHSLRVARTTSRRNQTTTTARRTETRTQPPRQNGYQNGHQNRHQEGNKGRRQESRPAQNTSRDMPKSRTDVKSATASPTRPVRVARNTRSAGERGRSRGGRSGKR